MMDPNDAIRFLYGPNGKYVFLGVGVLIALLFVFDGQAWGGFSKAPRRGGPPREGRLVRKLRDPVLWLMAVVAGLASWYFWPVAERWVAVFWAVPLLGFLMGDGLMEDPVCRFCGFVWSMNDF